MDGLPIVLKDSVYRLFKSCGQGALRSWDGFFVRFHGLPPVSIDELADNVDLPTCPIEEDRNLPPTETAGHDDFTPLARIIRAKNPTNILELGTGYGNTTANICALCQGHVYTVNATPDQMSGRIVTFSLTKEKIGRVYRRHGFSERVTQLYENTLMFDHRKHFPGALIDLAIIDACHDTRFVMNDFLKVLPTLRDGAIVLFHDTHPSRRRHLAGSYRACAHLRAFGFDVRHIANTWWGVWVKPHGDVRQSTAMVVLRFVLPLFLDPFGRVRAQAR